MPRTDLVRIACTLVALFLVQPVYASDKFPDYPIRPAGDYGITAEKAGLTIGVQPVEDLKEQKTYFHTELTPKGFVPVFVVIQNGSSGDSFLFDKTGITYGESESDGSAPDAHSKAGQATAVASLAALSFVGAVVAAKLMANATEVQQDILKKEVQSKTLSPGGSVHGFLYVPVQKKGPREKIRLRVPISRADTDETFVLDVVF